MKKYTVPLPDKKSNYSIIETGDFEYVNPQEKIMSMMIAQKMEMERDIIRLKGLEFPEDLLTKELIKRAIKSWDKQYTQIMSQNVPEELYELLKNPKKKKQEKLVKNLNLDTYQLMKFIFEAHNNYGYTYSQYVSEHLHKGLNKADLPHIIYLEDDDTVSKIGPTELTDGQLRQVVEHRRRTVAKFLDNGQNWHCFFLTLDSINGKENYKNGQPHMHYISNKWTIERQFVVKQLKSKNYSLPQLPHIHFERSSAKEKNRG